MTSSKLFVASGTTLAWLSRQFALVGGLLMVGVAVITLISILGRSLFGAAIEGDYEITQIVLAVSVFFFLPECQLRRCHVVVDFFTMNASARTIDLLDFLADLFFLIMSGVFIWRIALAGMESREYMEMTMIREIPVWWAYLAGEVSMVLLFLCCLHSALDKFLKRGSL